MKTLQWYLRPTCLWLALFAPAGHATTAYLQPQALFEGDIAELVIEHDSPFPSLYALDSETLNADFEILDIKSRVFRIDQQTSSMHRMQWRLQLLPRHSGTLQVPAIHFGDQSTPPLQLEVKPVPDELRSSQEVFVELESTPESPYVGQQTLLSMRLIHNTPLRIDGLAEPRLTDSVVYRDNGESVYFVNRNGTEYRVLERQMLIFPREPGELELPPAVLRGQLRQSPGAAGGSGSQNRKISRSSNPLRLQVRAPPATFSGRHWLPARDLRISQRLQAHAGELRIGDSVDWTLSLEAKGLPAAALPANLLEHEAANFTIYADQARRSDRLEEGNLYGRLEQRFAIIITAAGAVDLPEIKLAWWDLGADRERQVRLESTRLGYAQGTAGYGEQSTAEEFRLLFMPLSSDRGRLLWALPGLAGAVMLLAIAVMLHGRFAATGELLMRRWRIRGLLKQACRENQASRARALLIEWGRARWPGQTINGLYPISERCGSRELAAELAKLDAVLFSARKTRWQGSGLWAALSGSRRAVAGYQRLSGFPGLYPD